MQWRPAATTILLVVAAGLLVVQGGCTFDIGAREPQAPDTSAPGGTSVSPTPEVALSLTPDLTPVLQDLPSGDTHNSVALRFGPDGKLYVSLTGYTTSTALRFTRWDTSSW